MFKAWQSITLWKRVLIGMTAGLVVGIMIRYVLPLEEVTLGERSQTQTIPASTYIGNYWIYPIGEAFVRLIKMLIIPLIATTLVTGITAMGDPKKLGMLGARIIGLYFLTTFFAVSLGLLMGAIVKPGVGVDYRSVEMIDSSDLSAVQEKMETAKQFGGVIERVLDIIPSNPVAAMANGDVLPTFFFSILVGIGILLVGQPADPVKRFFESAAQVVMQITLIVMELAPWGVAALMAWVMCIKGIGVLTHLFWLVMTLYACCFIQIFVVYGLLMIRGVLKLPMRQFFRGVADAQGVAYSTASSSAALPVSISCAETNLGVGKSVAGSVLPLGATINMDGTAIYLGLVALFAAQASGIDVPLSGYLMVAITATLASIGVAGIPSAGLLLAATVMEVVGVPPEQSVLIIAFIFPFDRILDMMRTATNVTGDLAVACTVARLEGSLDEAVFRHEAKL